MSDLTDFLLTRIAEDEAAARAVAHEYHGHANTPISTGDDPWPSEREFAKRFTAARVMQECEARRRIVALWEDYRQQDHPAITAHATGLGLAIRELALVYAEHSDYREEWATI